MRVRGSGGLQSRPIRCIALVGAPGAKRAELHAVACRTRLDGDAGGYLAAADGFRTLGLPFWLAVTLLEHAELTADRASLDEARSIFEELKATPWLERAAAAADARAAQPAV